MKTMKSGNRKAEIKPTLTGYEVTCLLNENTLSRGFPIKEFKTLTGAERYANKFITFNNLI